MADDVYEEGIVGSGRGNPCWTQPRTVARGVPIAQRRFDGAKEADVNDSLTRAGFDTSGSVGSFDGRKRRGSFAPPCPPSRQIPALNCPPCGRQNPTAFRLVHHSAGPPSSALGGKAQVRCQRFGEMRGLGFGSLRAAYTLQEMLTVNRMTWPDGPRL